MYSDLAIHVEAVSKHYLLFNRPVDRLKQLLWPKRRQSSKTFTALNGINFDIRRGTTVGIIGHNGSGKSTLLQIICGTLEASEGKVTVAGRVASLLELGAGFNPEFTGRENVLMHGAIMGLSRDAILAKLPDIEAFAEIGNFIDQPVKTYSSGMYVRLAFSAAIHVEPDILIVDEALAVGDVAFQHKCMARMREFMKQGTVLFVSHDMNSVTSLCSEVIWLDHGRIRERGDPKSVAEHYLAHMYEQINANPSALPAPSKADAALQHSELQDRHNLEGKALDDFGSREVEVVGVALTDTHNTEKAEFKTGERAYLHITLRAKQAVAHPIVGFEMRDLRGNNVSSSNTDFETASLAALKADEVVSVRFAISWPALTSGSYALAVAIADGGEAQHRMLHWINNAAILHLQSRTPVMGMLRMEVDVASNQGQTR